MTTSRYLIRNRDNRFLIVFTVFWKRNLTLSLLMKNESILVFDHIIYWLAISEGFIASVSTLDGYSHAIYNQKFEWTQI